MKRVWNIVISNLILPELRLKISEKRLSEERNLKILSNLVTRKSFYNLYNLVNLIS